jgi:hypothetical protein
MKKRARTDRRETTREALKLADAREKLSRLEAGGEAGRPIRVESASVIELRAESMRCPRCDGDLKIAEHTAHVVDGLAVRKVDTRCKHCGAPRTIWFVIGSDLN